MVDNCRRGFDPIKDMEEVDQFGFIDLASAYATGSVSGSLNPEQSVMNGIEDPSSILGKPSDEFDAVRLNKYVRENGVEKKSE